MYLFTIDFLLILQLIRYSIFSPFYYLKRKQTGKQEPGLTQVGLYIQGLGVVMSNSQKYAHDKTRIRGAEWNKVQK